MADDLEALVQKLLKRVETLEAELVLAQEQLAAAKREIARKDQIIAALQQRLFGSKSERYHPDQEELDFGEDVLGKFEPSSSNQGNGEDTAGGKRAGSPKRLRKLAKLAGEPCFVHDLTLLGMGDDGHTASLFPGTTALGENERWVIENHVPQLDTWRITFTYPLIAASREVLFLVNGANKHPRAKEVLTGDPAFPASAITAGKVWWMIGG